jgi:phosphoserine phosphatase
VTVERHRRGPAVLHACDRGLAVFDLCGTLVTENTTYGFLQYYFRRRNGTRHVAIRFLRSLAGKAVSRLLSMALRKRGDVRRWSVGLLRGETVVEVELAAADYAREGLAPLWRPEVLETLHEARESGQCVVIASASLHPVANAVARELGLNHVFATTLEVIDGRFTGRLSVDLQGAKAQALVEAFPQVQIALVVTDNLDDCDLVRAAHTAIVLSRRRHFAWWRKRFGSTIRLVEI